MEANIQVEHLSKTIKKFKLQDIDFSVEPGYVLGLIGRNGAGKTTLLNTIMGLYTPEEGRILIGGYDRVIESIKAKEEIAFVTDECIFPMVMSPYMIGKIFGKVYTEFDYGNYHKLCRRFHLPMHKPLRKMSKGMIIKLQLAFAFSRDAKLYLFDEPSAGLDPVFRKELVDCMFDLLEDGKKTIIFSTHLTDELDRIADYILFLEDGKQLLFEQKEKLMSKYQLIRGSKEQIEAYQGPLIGKRITENCCEALIEIEEYPVLCEPRSTQVQEESKIMGIQDQSRVELLTTTPTIEDIMYYFIKGRM